MLVWSFAGVVLMFIVRVEFYPLADGKKTASIDCCVAPLLILALVEKFDAGVWRQVVVVDAQGPFKLHSIAIFPSEASTSPIEIGAVFVGD